MTGPAPRAGSLSVVVVIARYPPHHLGGYELRCRDVCREMARRGHRVTVLTSRAGGKRVEDDEGVRVVRALHLWETGVENGLASVLGFAFASGADCRRLRRETRRTAADAVAYWHQGGLTSALLAVRPPAGCGVLCDVSSDWLIDAATTGGNWFRVWRTKPGPRLRRTAKSFLRTFVAAVLGAPTERPDIPPGRAYFTSVERKRAHLDLSIPVEDAAVIRSGIDLDLFTFSAERPEAPRLDSERPAAPRALLFLGRLKRRKGLHTAVLALGYLPADVELRVVGPPEDPEYVAEVADLVRKTGVGGRVRLAGPVEHAEVPSLLRGVHALVFPSEEPEAFSRLVLEAFATGTPVVGTTLGGTAEVLREGETGLTHAPGNARELADQLARLLGDADLRARLVRNARSLVETSYSLGFTVSQIEVLLRDARRRAAPAVPAEGLAAAGVHR
jgi:glycosyltransferase involved in cell wall biosynthesis